MSKATQAITGPRFRAQSEVDGMRGRVSSFNLDRGFGWIQPDDGSRDVFVHIRQVEAAGLTTLSVGDRVEYTLVPGRDGKVSAQDLKVVE